MNRHLLLALVLATAAFSLRATAEQATPPAQEPGSAEILNRLQQLSEELERVRAELNQLKAQRAAEKARAAEADAAPAPAPAPEAVLPVEKAEPKPEVDEEQARMERERAIRSVQRSGVLLKGGSIEVEPGFTYSHYSSNLISIDGFAFLPVLVIGQIESLRIERDIFQPTLTLRYGILDNLQADVTVPYRFERDRFVRQVEDLPREEQSISDHGLSDVEFGLSYQLLYEQGWIPDLIVAARAKAPTGKSLFDIGGAGTNVTELVMGSGVWSVRSSVTAIKSLDPAILIFTAGYTHSLGRDFTVLVADPQTNAVPRRTTFEPGGTVDYGLAVAVAMNPVFAINLQLQQRITLDTHLAGIGKVEGSFSNQADIRFGFGWALTQKMVLNFTAAAGLTEDTPDLTVSLALPVKF